jgi:hypothetical protein
MKPVATVPTVAATIVDVETIMECDLYLLGCAVQEADEEAMASEGAAGDR